MTSLSLAAPHLAAPCCLPFYAADLLSAAAALTIATLDAYANHGNFTL